MKTPAQLWHIIRTWRHVPTSVWKAWERYRHPKPSPSPAFLTMFDSITLDAIPLKAEAVAGYVGGLWATFRELAARWPNSHRLSIAVTPSESADCLDVEKGDARPEQAPAWLKSPLAKSAATTKTVLYSSRDAWPELIKLLEGAGIPRSGYLIWSAHYTKKPHLCGPDTCGATFHADATQYDNRALGRNLDVSWVRAGFFRGT